MDATVLGSIIGGACAIIGPAAAVVITKRYQAHADGELAKVKTDNEHNLELIRTDHTQNMEIIGIKHDAAMDSLQEAHRHAIEILAQRAAGDESRFKKEVAEAYASLLETSKTIQRLENDIRSLHTNLSNYQALEGDLRQQISELEGQLQSYREDMTNIRRENQRQIVALSNTNEQLREEKEALAVYLKKFIEYTREREQAIDHLSAALDRAGVKYERPPLTDVKYPKGV